MSDIVQIFKQKANKCIELEKTKELIPMKIEQYNELMDKIMDLENENEFLKKRNEKLENDLKKTRHNYQSVNGKYNNLLRKSKNEVYDELKETMENKLRKDLEYCYEINYRIKVNEVYSNYAKEVEEETKKRILNIEEAKDLFNKKINEEIDRYVNLYDIEQENNKGYFIGIMKTKKILNEVFNNIRLKKYKKIIGDDKNAK